jgi:hypothetical protein
MSDWGCGRNIPREKVVEQLEEILKLRDATRLECSASADNKDARALRAIELFGCVANGAVDWALNHVAGRALDPEADINEHDHELRGRAITDRDLIRRHKKYRPALAELLRCLRNLMPGSTGEVLARAIMGLNEREILLIFRPLRGKRKTDNLWNRRLEAVFWWHYLQARGEENCLQDVHQAFGYEHSTRTIPKWKERLKKLDQGRLEETISAAEEIARYMALTEIDRQACKLSPASKKWLNRMNRVPMWEAGRRYKNNQWNEEVNSA